MKRNIISMLSMLLMVLLMNVTLSISATNIKKTAKTITVAKTGGDYKTISTALTAINDASDKKPYVIKVMPGIYDESIQMKPYVDVVGSGQENTQITSSNAFTVMGADNSILENIWIDSTGASSSQSYNPSAILNDGTSMTINNVKATMNDPVVPEYGGGAIHASVIQTLGAGAKPVISNCTIYGTGTNQRSIIGIGIYDYGSSTITNCDITIDTSEDTPGPSYISWNVGINGNAIVTNSTIKVKGADHNQGIKQIKKIKGSRIESIATYNTVSNVVVDASVVADSEIIMVGTAKETNCAVSATGNKITKSLIDGPICGKENKIVKSWDKKKKPIQNR